MKKIILLLITICLKLSIFGQIPGAAGNAKTQAPPSIGHIYGKLVDSSGKALSDVSIILLQNRRDPVSGKTKDVLVKGLTTKSNGEFSFEELPLFGRYNLKISATGYKAIEKPVAFKLQMPSGGPAKPGDDNTQAMKSISEAINGFELKTENLKSITVEEKGYYLLNESAILIDKSGIMIQARIFQYSNEIDYVCNKKKYTTIILNFVVVSRTFNIINVEKSVANIKDFCDLLSPSQK